jgi:hypothetical protein
VLTLDIGIGGSAEPLYRSRLYFGRRYSAYAPESLAPSLEAPRIMYKESAPASVSAGVCRPRDAGVRGGIAERHAGAREQLRPVRQWYRIISSADFMGGLLDFQAAGRMLARVSEWELYASSENRRQFEGLRAFYSGRVLLPRGGYPRRRSGASHQPYRHCRQ